jgi:hypothetical protein
MAFVNEYIPADDFKKYGFEQLNRRTSRGSTPADDWTIDRDADIWLREFYVETDHTAVRGGFTGVSAWDFYWKGHLMMVKLKNLETGGGVRQHCWARKKLLSIDIPAKIECMRTLIVKDLEAALTAFKDGGVVSSATSFSFTLEA